jgi:hypothetical protein
MLHLVDTLLFIAVFNGVCVDAGWNPAKFSFNPGNNYDLI